jgi:hypothetical protein
VSTQTRLEREVRVNNGSKNCQAATLTPQKNTHLKQMTSVGSDSECQATCKVLGQCLMTQENCGKQSTVARAALRWKTAGLARDDRQLRQARGWVPRGRSSLEPLLLILYCFTLLGY